VLNRLSEDGDVTTLQTVELGVLGPLQVRQYGLPVSIPGAKPRAILTMLGLHGGSVVSADTFIELLWGADPPRTAAKALQTHISSLRRTLGDGFVLTEGSGWTLRTSEIDASRYKVAVKAGREAVAAGDTSQAVARFDEALALWRGIPELPDGQRGGSEKTRWIEGHAALVEDRADALLATGRAAEIIGELEAAIADAPLRERRWGQLMLALYRAGRQGEALGAYQRARALLADELGVDPGSDLRRLEAAIVAQDAALEMPAVQNNPSVTRAVTFLLTDIEGSTAAWEADADAMAMALARHDELVEQVVTSRGGRLVKTRGEGDATFSVFDRPSAAAAAAIDLQEAIFHEPWDLPEAMRIRVALHTGEVELRDGDYFGRAVNRAARLRSLAAGGQILCSGATAELVIDSLSDDIVLADLGMRQLRNLARPEHVFELRFQNSDDDSQPPATEEPIVRPALPAVLAGPGPFVGRGHELDRLLSGWQRALAGDMQAVLIAGEPGVGKTRLAGEWSSLAFDQGAVVLYGRCDEDLGAPYQPFAEAMRALTPCLGATRLRELRGVEALLPLVPGLTDVLPDLATRPRADADTERYALFDAVVALLGIASANAPVVLILDDLHWAAKPTLLLLRHLLRFGEHSRVQIVGTYRSTDLDRSHPLAGMLADLHRDGTAHRIHLSGLDEQDVTTYVAEAGYDDEELARALASVTGGNPFFLIEALRHVDESGGVWDPGTLPQGVREAVSRRLSRLSAETNKALGAAAVVGSRFALELVERVVEQDLVDAFDEACKAGIVVEEPGGRYRFTHAIVRQSLLAELASVRRMRLHQRIAAALETESATDDELLAELAYHYFECAWAGNAAKAVEYCRRAADQAMSRLAYEGAADFYDRALHALEELDEDLPDRDDQQAELLVARCEALLAAGDVSTAVSAVSQLQAAARDSARLAAWGTCFHGQLSMLTDPERLDEIESAVGEAAERLAGLDDAAGEAKAHTVRAGCLARLGRIGDCETTLDHALTAARRAGEHRRVNAVLANAPLAALWGPNPVPRAGGRCLDVVRLLRITTGSPVVEATSTRCQAVLDAFRGRAAAARSLIDSARRTLTDLGLRHAVLEVDQFAGIVELVADDPAAAEPYLRRACTGFRRMGLDADTAETAALLARACLALDRDAEASELCTESERLAGHALKASNAWRMVRAQLLARGGAHDEARQVAEEAVSLAERTDALVDHGDACLTLAAVLDAAGDASGARAAAAQAVSLYERKGAAALVEKARRMLGRAMVPVAPATPQAPQIELDNECWRVAKRAMAAINREALEEAEQLWAPDVLLESRRMIVGFAAADLQTDEWPFRRALQAGGVRVSQDVIAIRGERLALTRTAISTTDVSPGAPRDEFLRVFGIDQEGRIAWEVWFDVDDIDAAVAELDAAHARLEERPRAPLENAASRAERHLNALFADRRWDEIAALLADNVRVEERRRGFSRRESTDRAQLMAEVHVVGDLGVKTITSDPVAIRGQRLVLSRVRFSGRDLRPDAYRTEVFRLAEIDNDGRVVSFMTFEIDDLDTAFEELDARYVAGEAAPYAHVWRRLMDAVDELNRHAPGPTLAGFQFVDHRRVPFAPGDFERAIEDLWALVPDARYRVTRVHALDFHGAVASLVIDGTDENGNELQWARVFSWVSETIQLEVYEEDDLDAALARFAELHPQAPRLENVATRSYERIKMHFAERDWNGAAEILAGDIVTDDRRNVVNAGIIHGREGAIADISAMAEVGVDSLTSDTIATRGDRLVLNRAWASLDEYRSDLLDVVETNAEGRIERRVVFDGDDFDAAMEELDARYLAGEAAAHARTWSAVAETYSSFNRHEQFAIDWVLVDHRRGTPFASNIVAASGHAAVWDLTPDLRIYVEMVHRLSDHGVVVTHNSHGTSPEGFGAEWRMIQLLTFEGDRINRCELFDDTDLDSALARFDELTKPAPRPENDASQAYDRFCAFLVARDWDAMGEIVTDDVCNDDRRRVVSSGIQSGRDAQIANFRAISDVGVSQVESIAIATRGNRLALTRTRASTGGSGADDFSAEMLTVIEVTTDNRISARVTFDVDDSDAAFEELDTRYLAGEAAAHARTWSVLVSGYASLNRHEVPSTTTDFVSIDHRYGIAFASGDLIPYIRASVDVSPDITVHVQVVHQLKNRGAVVTHAASGTSPEGFNAEWREVSLFTVDGDSVNRCEMFDEADLDSALARFDELTEPAPRPENDASRVIGPYLAHFAARDWDAMADLVADDFSTDDRRKVVNAGIQRGRDAEVTNVRAVADVGVENITPTVIATRGRHLVLYRSSFSIRDWHTEDFVVVEVAQINADNQMLAHVVFDPDDIDAAFDELDARYLAGEAAVHAHTWSVIADAYAAMNRHELPATAPDWANIDHRPLAPAGSGDLIAYMSAYLDLQNICTYVEAVHRLTDLGAVVTHVGTGTSQEGFDAEWRTSTIYAVDGDLLSRCEIFDEEDIGAAIARFEELHRQPPRLENAASRMYVLFNAHLADRDWDAMAEMVTDDVCSDDRRRVVSGGIQRGRDAQITNLRAVVDVGVKYHESIVIATRGERLALTRTRVSGGGQRSEAFEAEMLTIIEIHTDNRIAAGVMFNVDDIDAAFAELDARYLAGEAAAHARTWSVLVEGYTALNRHEVPPTTPDFVNIDHRPLALIGSGDLTAYARSTLDAAQDVSTYSESVHRLTASGVVFTHVGTTISDEGFTAEWRLINVVMVDGDRVSRCEIFDEANLDAALERFEELTATKRLENAATRTWTRIVDACNRRDADGFLALSSADGSLEDRRKGLRASHVGSERRKAAQSMCRTPESWRMEVEPVAIRGNRLGLTRERWRDTDEADQPITVESLTLTEVTVDELAHYTVVFDPDDINGAFHELTARWIASGEVNHPEVIEAHLQILQELNRHDWDAVIASLAGATYINHRQLGSGETVADFATSVTMIASLIPNVWVEPAEILKCSAAGAVGDLLAKGTSSDGIEVEIPMLLLGLFDRDRLTRFELFDPDQRELALARFEELSQQA
jgi:class 3 adenylate cyclase